MKRKKSKYIEISRKNLTMIVIGVVIIVVAHFPIKNYLQEKKMQADCPQNFYKFENDDFSVCYPKDMRVNAYSGKSMDNLDIESVKFSSPERKYEIIPRFQFGQALNKCMKNEVVDLPNGEAKRLVFRSETSAEECGDIQNIISNISSKQNASWVYLLSEPGSNGFNMTEYTNIESSLVLK